MQERIGFELQKWAKKIFQPLFDLIDIMIDTKKSDEHCNFAKSYKILSYLFNSKVLEFLDKSISILFFIALATTKFSLTYAVSKGLKIFKHNEQTRLETTRYRS